MDYYVIDGIADGMQQFDCGIFPATLDYALERHAARVTSALSVDDYAGLELSIRLISEGEIVAETTVKDGEILAAYVR